MRNFAGTALAGLLVDTVGVRWAMCAGPVAVAIAACVATGFARHLKEPAGFSQARTLTDPPCFSRHRAAKDMVLPLATPVRGHDGRVMEELVVPEGTGMLLHYQGSNNTKELWGDDANEWKPERWLAPFPQALEDARIPGVYSNL